MLPRVRTPAPPHWPRPSRTQRDVDGSHPDPGQQRPDHRRDRADRRRTHQATGGLHPRAGLGARPAARRGGRLGAAGGPGPPGGGAAPPPGPTVRPVVGDVTAPDWDLAPPDLDPIRRGVDLIIHGAADTSFIDHSGAGRTNVESVRWLIDLARRCERNPLIVYLSTASNVGRVSHCVVGEEDGCRPGNEHHNEYTRSKAVAEELLRASGLPVLVLRPTIVLSAGLPDAGFAKQILWCVPLTRCFRALPVDPAARLDLVDVGFVADPTLALPRPPDRRFRWHH